MHRLRRSLALAPLMVLIGLTAARAQLDPAHQMLPGFVVVPSPVFPRYAPAPAFAPPVYQPGVQRYLPSDDAGMAGGTFHPQTPPGYTPFPSYATPTYSTTPSYRPQTPQYAPNYGRGMAGSTFDPGE